MFADFSKLGQDIDEPRTQNYKKQLQNHLEVASSNNSIEIVLKERTHSNDLA